MSKRRSYKEDPFNWKAPLHLPEGCEAALVISYDQGRDPRIFRSNDLAQEYYDMLKGKGHRAISVSRCAVMLFPDGKYRQVKINKIFFGEDDHELCNRIKTSRPLRRRVRVLRGAEVSPSVSQDPPGVASPQT